MDILVSAIEVVMFGIWAVLTCILLYMWQKTKYKMIDQQKELELRDTYDKAFGDLLLSVRKRQHEFDNHINAIYSQHMLAGSLEELVQMQNKYCMEIRQDNRYNKLLSNGSSLISGFLFSKFTAAEQKGCEICYKVSFDRMDCRIPHYQLVEILGILFDNAVEAVAGQPENTVNVELMERPESIHIKVSNPSSYVSQKEIHQFLRPEISTKGEGRGLGLARVVDILVEHGCEMRVYNDRSEPNQFVFEIEIEKGE